MESELDWIQDNVFSPSCASFSVCHQGAAASAEGLNLESGMTMTNIVGVESDQVAGMNIVEAGDPDNSYLLIKLGRGEFPPGSKQTTMPLSNPTLCDEKVDAIARWISSL